MANFYFCWEKGPTGQWQPVCYHGEHPMSPQVTRSGVIPVPADMIGDDGQPRFGALARRYPAPAPVEDGGAT